MIKNKEEVSEFTAHITLYDIYYFITNPYELLCTLQFRISVNTRKSRIHSHGYMEDTLCYAKAKDENPFICNWRQSSPA